MKDKAVAEDVAVVQEAEGVSFCSHVVICWMRETFIQRAHEDADTVIRYLTQGVISKKEVRAILKGFRNIARRTKWEALRKEAVRIVAAVSTWFCLHAVAPEALAPAH